MLEPILILILIDSAEKILELTQKLKIPENLTVLTIFNLVELLNKFWRTLIIMNIGIV